jgi:putative CocE/NonD family hydrolase
MTVRTDFPHKIREIEHAWIELGDGTRLAARYWLPVDAEDNPVPAILEYIPYCKRDGTAARDEAMHPYFAGHGYAAVRVDMRGSGESDGVLRDEYLQQEHDDGVEVIAWLARQPWCTGKVGMMGKSWGGFNCLQVAALRPPELAAILSVCSTDDRYADDVHYMGGCLLTANATWAYSMFTRQGRPPDPALAGESWRDTWMQRLEAVEPWLVEWLKHQTRDAYWKHGSVCENYDDIQVPVYAIGGWADSYSNAIPRLLAGLSVPTKGLVGPWGHQYPHQGHPLPKAGFLQDALRWWDHWLKGIDTGMMDEPAYRVWMQEYAHPTSYIHERPGRWVAEAAWPSSRITEKAYFLNADGLADAPKAGPGMLLSSPQTTGMTVQNWIHGGAKGLPDEPVDQRPDDANSLTFDSAPLADDMDILGAATVSIEFQSETENAFVCARICEVLPDGTSQRVTYGLLNLTHLDGHETPRPLVPGQTNQATIQLNDIAHRFAAGNCIRVALSTAYWPIIWPSPDVARLSIPAGSGKLNLPVRPPVESDADLGVLPPAESSALAPRTTLRKPEPLSLKIDRDFITGLTQITKIMDHGHIQNDDSGWRTDTTTTRVFEINDLDPLSARFTSMSEVLFGRDGMPEVTISVDHELTASRDKFHVHANMIARENGEEVFRRKWTEVVPRNCL